MRKKSIAEEFKLKPIERRSLISKVNKFRVKQANFLSKLNREIKTIEEYIENKKSGKVD